jgi:hypothetical protein
LIRRLAEYEEEARRREVVIFTFEEAALRYLEEIAHKSSANTIAVILDSLFPYIGKLPIAHVHDGARASTRYGTENDQQCSGYCIDCSKSVGASLA